MAKTNRSQWRISSWVIWLCIVVQFACLMLLAWMNYGDERLEKESLSSLLLGHIDAITAGYRLPLQIITYVLGISLGLFAAGLILGEQKQRSLRNMFILTSMIAVTLALFTNWQRISWEGRRHRMSARIESLQVICDALQQDWPTTDSNHELLGSIMAYPQWRPSTLILLTPKPIDRRFHIAAIDRSKTGVLRFELSSGFETIWIEHRFDTLLEQEFTNGIEQNFVRQYYVSLSPGWYLVRYE